MIRNCKVCNKEFKTYPSKIKLGKGKYCSRKCSDAITLMKKGECLSPKTQIKKGEKLRLGKTGTRPLNYKGFTINDQGYRLIHRPNHPNCNKDGYVREHRLVAEKQIGRYLHKFEIVHHINEVRDDNRPENIMVFSNMVSHLNHHRGYPYPEDDVIYKGGVANVVRYD